MILIHLKSFLANEMYFAGLNNEMINYFCINAIYDFMISFVKLCHLQFNAQRSAKITNINLLMIKLNYFDNSFLCPLSFLQLHR